jgi:GT2 family glycosyltransferase
VTFSEHFLRLLPRRPWPALAALYWHLTRRKLRARIRLRVASADLPFAYKLWIASNERNHELRQHLDARMKGWAWQPSFSVVLHDSAGSTKEQFERSTQSVESQIYPHRSWTDAAPESLGAAVHAVEADYVVPLRIGDTLSEAALYRLAEKLQDNPEAAVIYGDEDRLDTRARRGNPWFKPQWNQEFFYAQDYLSSAVAIEASLAKRAAVRSGDSLAALLLDATAASDGPIVHVPHILTHVGVRNSFPPNRAALVARHLEAKGAKCAPGRFGTVKVEWPLPDELPLVSMIIPTKDKLELLRPCVESLLKRTDYPNFEILVVDNQSVEKRTADFLREIDKHPKVRVLPYHAPFNYSAINNFAARSARGSYLCLLNNDTEVVEACWLSELMRYAVRPDIGAAGAKLLYEDRTIQHAGVVIGIGEAAGHVHRFLPADQPGYFHHAHIAQFISAVTGACLVIAKDKFDAVGGLDEKGLAVAFNDVDLCLRLEQAGWRNVYVPHAVLLHHESKSRGDDMAARNVARYRRELQLLQDRWGTKTYQDPLHNPNLDRYSETCVIKL